MSNAVPQAATTGSSTSSDSPNSAPGPGPGPAPGTRQEAKDAAKAALKTETAPEKAPETAVTPPAEKPGERSKQFNALAKKEREIQKREGEMKARLEKYEAFEKANQGADPATTLQAFAEAKGITPDALYDWIVNGAPAPKPEDKVAALEKRIDAAEQQRLNETKAALKAEQEGKIESYKQQVGKYLAETDVCPVLKGLAETKVEGFEAINPAELVYQYQLEIFQREKKAVPLPEAAAAFEKEIIEEAEKMQKKAGAILEVVNRIRAAQSGESDTASVETPEGTPAPKTPVAGFRTLKNEHVAGGSTPSEREMTREERRTEAKRWVQTQRG